MGPGELLRWQWDGYPKYHRNRTNLLLHVFAVPLFWVGMLWLAAAVLRLDGAALLLGAACLLVSIVAQGRGHKLEALPPEPFTGPGNFIGRLIFEQWITFPRFVLTGGWRRNFNAR